MRVHLDPEQLVELADALGFRDYVAVDLTELQAQRWADLRARRRQARRYVTPDPKGTPSP